VWLVGLTEFWTGKIRIKIGILNLPSGPDIKVVPSKKKAKAGVGLGHGV